MRISFNGQYTLDELEDALKRSLDHMRGFNVEEVHGVNLYFTALSKRRPMQFLDEDGLCVEHLVIDEPISHPLPLTEVAKEM